MEINIMKRNLAIIVMMMLSLSACKTKPIDTVDASGANIVPGSQQDLEVNVGDHVLFAFDSSVLSTEARETLTRQAAWMQANPTVSVIVEGHCDDRGTREYNLALGERRANAAKHFLEKAGVEASRIVKIHSYGKERPIVTGEGEEFWRQNRRAVTVVAAAN